MSAVRPPSISGPEFRGRRVVVMGLGRFGGGIGVTRWLAGQGADVVITDLAQPEELAVSVSQLKDVPFDLVAGNHPVSLLDDCHLLVVSPAVDKNRSEFFREAVRRDLPWTSEMNLFLERCPARTVGVTGSLGKSTTAAMIAAALQCARRSGDLSGEVWLGGNIGRSLLEDLPAMGRGDAVVLELSSFQLEDLARLRRSPNVAVLTNLSPNHLDRHGTPEAYYEAKRNIIRFQAPGEPFVALADDPVASAWIAGRRGPLLTFSLEPGGATISPARDQGLIGLRPEVGEPTPLFSADDLRVPGRHNLLNAMAAAGACVAVGSPAECIVEGLRSFAGLPHRLELVREYGGVRYYNDSKSTTPESTVVAVNAFDGRPVVLVGGYDKKLPLDSLASVLADRAKAVICFGAARVRLRSAVERHRREPGGPSVKTVHDFRGGVNLARRLARPGDVVLLSPGCASYDQFHNYEERGDLFRRIVNDWV